MGPIPATSWTLIGLASEPQTPAGREAISRFLTRYLPAMRAHLVFRRGWSPGDVDDVLQAFIANHLLTTDVLGKAERGRRFRNYFLTVLDNFASKLRRWDRAKKRRPQHAVSLESEQEAGLEPAATEDSADVFDLEWARQLLAEVIRRMQEQCSGRRKDIWEIFHERMLAPMLDDVPPTGYEVLVPRLGLESAAQAANLLVTGKRMFERVLREVIGEYSAGEAEIEAEIEDLIAILSRRPSHPS